MFGNIIFQLQLIFTNTRLKQTKIIWMQILRDFVNWSLKTINLTKNFQRGIFPNFPNKLKIRFKMFTFERYFSLWCQSLIFIRKSRIYLGFLSNLNLVYSNSFSKNLTVLALQRLVDRSCFLWIFMLWFYLQFSNLKQFKWIKTTLQFQLKDS